MKIHRFALGEMAANCYLLEEEEEAILIDPGDSADFIVEQIERRHLQLRAIILTHGHFDHTMAVGEVQRTLQEAPCYLHPNDFFLFKRTRETAEAFLDVIPPILPPTQVAALCAGSLSLGTFRFNVIETPGHTPGSCSLHMPQDRIVFTGDTVFAHGRGRTDFSYSSPLDLVRSCDTLAQLPPDTIVYSGHGEESTAGEIFFEEYS